MKEIAVGAMHIFAVALIAGAVIFVLGGAFRAFGKAGVPGILILIPIVNVWFSVKIAWGSGWYSLLLLIPAVNIAVWILRCFKMAKAFGRSSFFALGLFFLPQIFLALIGWSDDSYLGPS